MSSMDACYSASPHHDDHLVMLHSNKAALSCCHMLFVPTCGMPHDAAAQQCCIITTHNAGHGPVCWSTCSLSLSPLNFSVQWQMQPATRPSQVPPHRPILACCRARTDQITVLYNLPKVGTVDTAVADELERKLKEAEEQKVGD